jgi:hypothetical protein
VGPQRVVERERQQHAHGRRHGDHLEGGAGGGFRREASAGKVLDGLPGGEFCREIFGGGSAIWGLGRGNLREMWSQVLRNACMVYSITCVWSIFSPFRE